jgi:hypothetical protein
MSFYVLTHPFSVFEHPFLLKNGLFCKKCQDIRDHILKSSSEESGDEKSTTSDDNDDTPYLSSEDSDTDWDDPHNGQHPNCTDCENIREDDCEDDKCNEHGAGDTEGYEEPPDVREF